MDLLASQHASKDFKSFWKHTNRLNPRPGVPGCVGGECEPQKIAELFKEQFKVEPLLKGSRGGVSSCSGERVLFTVKETKQVLKNMTRGRSPGHDSLSVEHLQSAGVHLPRVLTLFFNLCVGHSYLPADLMRTVVVPIMKNRTGDASDRSNYRPISLATIIAKVLDGLLNSRMAKYINIHDAQFGFRSGLSTESAILCLKHTVQYYTDRKTPVFACFLDLSKAFDLVSYDILWEKLGTETEVPDELISILRFWYGNQVNQVRWNRALSSEYTMECGVRQGGLTSPSLFNCYLNGLIEELSNTGIGCSVDGVSFNNISYADDMVLLSPSVGGLQKLLNICVRYADAHGLRYNGKKSEFLVFRGRSKLYSTIPQVYLKNEPLNRVFKFKYLGHLVTDDLRDNEDIERERRALAVRCNMVARRFARSTCNVKVTLFKAYCQSFYSCSLWVSYSRLAADALRVQYNNGLRVLLGLPRYCSASGMHAEHGVATFQAIRRQRIASLMQRVRGSSNSMLKLIANKLESPIWRYWIGTHKTI